MDQHILVAEDHPRFRTLLGQCLQDAGYRVLLAADGEEAIRQVSAARPDLVLTDVEMPRRSGLEVLGHVKAATPTTPVLLLTGCLTAEIAAAAQALGAQAVLEKPCDLEALLGCITRALRPAGAPG
jgi:CheY-like chemotaxis protein